MKKTLVLIALLLTSLTGCVKQNGTQTDEPTETLMIKGLEGCLSYEIVTHHRTVIVIRCPEATTASFSPDGGKTFRRVTTDNFKGESK